MTQKNLAQKGFSLMELLIALMIIGVIATLGIRALRGNTDKARYIKANDTIRMMAEGLEQHYLALGRYPEGSTWESLAGPESILVKKNYIPANMPINDPWGVAYEAKVTRSNYELICQGDPNDQESHPQIKREPGRQTGGPGAGGNQAPKTAAPAGEPPK
jgi:general secretion pathway protein G